MTYTQEQLEQMPLNLLRGIDIKSQEEEVLIQNIINKKMAEMPIMIDMDITSSQTDNMTPEKEALLQAEIDEKRAEAKLKFVPFKDTIGTPEEAAAPQEKEIETMVETVKETLKKPFCEFCGSKGVRHKKECTRLSANNTI